MRYNNTSNVPRPKYYEPLYYKMFEYLPYGGYGIIKEYKGKEEVKLKYKLIKRISLIGLVEANACTDSIIYYLEQYGKNDITNWTKKEEEIDSSLIKWLLENKYIEKINKIEYNPLKVYIIRYNKKDYKLTEIGEKYSFISLDNSCISLTGVSDSAQKLIDHWTLNGVKISVCESTYEFYHKNGKANRFLF